MIKVNCTQCSKELDVFPARLRKLKNGRIFCSRKCKGEWSTGKPLVKQEIKSCSVCNKDVYVSPHYARKHKKFFCSPKCKNSYNFIDVSCRQCRKIVSRRRVEVEIMKFGPFCSPKCFFIWRKENNVYVGEGNPAWKGGYSSPNYNYNWKRQRAKARKRDNYTCQDCGMTQQEWGYFLDVHHIVAYDLFEDPKKANDLSNLVTLCRRCHVKKHKVLEKEVFNYEMEPAS
jgi:5-methylcytosine-specific restriction endonuclease McrA